MRVGSYFWCSGRPVVCAARQIENTIYYFYVIPRARDRALEARIFYKFGSAPSMDSRHNSSQRTFSSVVDLLIESVRFILRAQNI